MTIAAASASQAKLFPPAGPVVLVLRSSIYSFEIALSNLFSSAVYRIFVVAEQDTVLVAYQPPAQPASEGDIVSI